MACARTVSFHSSTSNNNTHIANRIGHESRKTADNLASSSERPRNATRGRCAPTDAISIDVQDKSTGSLFKVPMEHVLDTKGRADFLRIQAMGHIGRDGRKPFVFCNYFQQGKCYRNEQCSYIHVHQHFVQSMTAAHHEAPCCAHHGDPCGVMTEHELRTQVGLVDPTGVVKVGPTTLQRFARTKGLDAHLLQATKAHILACKLSGIPNRTAMPRSLEIQTSDLCMAHLVNACELRQDCPMIHMCRVEADHRNPPPQHMSTCSSERDPSETESPERNSSTRVASTDFQRITQRSVDITTTTSLRGRRAFPSLVHAPASASSSVSNLNLGSSMSVSTASCASSVHGSPTPSPCNARAVVPQSALLSRSATTATDSTIGIVYGTVRQKHTTTTHGRSFSANAEPFFPTAPSSARESRRGSSTTATTRSSGAVGPPSSFGTAIGGNASRSFGLAARCEIQQSGPELCTPSPARHSFLRPRREHLHMGSMSEDEDALLGTPLNEWDEHEEDAALLVALGTDTSSSAAGSRLLPLVDPRTVLAICEAFRPATGLMSHAALQYPNDAVFAPSPPTVIPPNGNIDKTSPSSPLVIAHSTPSPWNISARSAFTAMSVEETSFVTSHPNLSNSATPQPEAPTAVMHPLHARPAPIEPARLAHLLSADMCLGQPSSLDIGLIGFVAREDMNAPSPLWALPAHLLDFRSPTTRSPLLRRPLAF